MENYNSMIFFKFENIILNIIVCENIEFNM